MGLNFNIDFHRIFTSGSNPLLWTTNNNAGWQWSTHPSKGEGRASDRAVMLSLVYTQQVGGCLAAAVTSLRCRIYRLLLLFSRKQNNTPLPINNKSNAADDPNYGKPAIRCRMLLCRSLISAQDIPVQTLRHSKRHSDHLDQGSGQRPARTHDYAPPPT